MGACGSKSRVQPTFDGTSILPQTPRDAAGEPTGVQTSGTDNQQQSSDPTESLAPGSARTESGMVVRAPQDQNSAAKLIAAAKMGDEAAVAELIAQGTSPDSRGMWDNTPLLVSAKYGYSGLSIRLLREWNADPALANEKNVTPLLHGCVEGDTKLVKALLENSAPVDPVPGSVYNSMVDANMRLTPLVAACMNGHAQIVQALLEAGAQIDRRVATSPGKTGTDKASDEDDGGNSALFFACEHAQIGVVRTLLKHNASCDSLIDDSEGSPLLLACSGRRQNHDEHDSNLAELVQTLPEAVRLKVIAAPDRRGTTALHAACQRKLPKAALAMITSGASVHAADSKEATPLLYACQQNLEEVVHALLEAGADPQVRDRHGRTPLSIASKSRKGESIVANLQEYLAAAH